MMENNMLFFTTLLQIKAISNIQMSLKKKKVHSIQKHQVNVYSPVSPRPAFKK